jgi:hypothetical protein
MRPGASPAVGGLAGQTVGSYRLVSQIGREGWASCGCAERSDGRFERRVAVKRKALFAEDLQAVRPIFTTVLLRRWRMSSFFTTCVSISVLLPRRKLI